MTRLETFVEYLQEEKIDQSEIDDIILENFYDQDKNEILFKDEYYTILSEEEIKERLYDEAEEIMYAAEEKSDEYLISIGINTSLSINVDKSISNIQNRLQIEDYLDLTKIYEGRNYIILQ